MGKDTVTLQRKSRLRPRPKSKQEREAMLELRTQVWLRDGATCQLRIPPNPGDEPCWDYVCWDFGHLSHIKSRGAGGEDTPENCVWSCPPCHMRSHNSGGKPVPRKEPCR